MANNQINLYGASWCPDTLRARHCLESHGISFIWHDIEQDSESCAFVEKVNRGKRVIPVIVLSNGATLIEPSIAELEYKLGLKKI
jgi:glutaredoxin